MSMNGQCLCGAIHLEAAGNPLGSRMCWCADCQRACGGSASVNVLFPAGAVTWIGAPATWLKTADSGNTVERGFCPTCGTQLYSRILSDPEAPVRIRAGVLDDRAACPPTAAIWMDSAPDWVRIDPAMPKLRKGPGSDPAD